MRKYLEAQLEIVERKLREAVEMNLKWVEIALYEEREELKEQLHELDMTESAR